MAGNVNDSLETRTVTTQLVGAPSADRFKITNSSGDTISSIDDKGDMYLKNTASVSQGSLTVPSNSFIVQNSSGTVIAYFNNTGGLFTFGTISMGSDLSGLTSSNLEIRNSSNSLVAFFDNLGNLKLQGGYLENYASPVFLPLVRRVIGFVYLIIL
jgi:hypothetical protein